MIINENLILDTKFKNPKFEVDKESIYIPNVNDLEPSKQAIFVAGGYSKTYSLNKTRLGVGIC